MHNKEKPLVATVYWPPLGMLHRAQEEVVNQLGYRSCFLKFDEKIPPSVDILLIQGPYGSLVPIIRQIESISRKRRPVIAYWFQQSLFAFLPLSLHNLLGKLFSEARSILTSTSNESSMWKEIINRRFTKRGSRLKFLGDIFWLHNKNLLDVIAVSSTEYADIFIKLGMNPLFVMRGYHRSYGKNLGLSRDIALTWMGKTRNKRRRDIVYWLKHDLEKRNLKMNIHDNESLPFIFDEERTTILNRSWFSLNLFTFPTDELSIRYFISAANGAVVITEPGKNIYPFKNGTHYIECLPESMPDMISYYINNYHEWRKISQNMRDCVTTKYSLTNSINIILSQAEQKLQVA